MRLTELADAVTELHTSKKSSADFSSHDFYSDPFHCIESTLLIRYKTNIAAFFVAASRLKMPHAPHSVTYPFAFFRADAFNAYLEWQCPRDQA